MNEAHIETIAAELQIRPGRVQAAAALIEQGATVPFIARYRKEATGSLDEVAVSTIRDRLVQLAELDKRREAILRSLEEQGVLTDELKATVQAAWSLTELEDIYLPYRPKRRTRATAAKEKGLEPLAIEIFEQQTDDLKSAAAPFVRPEDGVADMEEALAGARDIIAEWVNENKNAREAVRKLYRTDGEFISKVVEGMEEQGVKYRDYFEWSEPVSSAPSHRVLAMRRAEKEGFTMLRVTVPEEKAVSLLETLFIKGFCAASGQVRLAVEDAYKRLLSHSIETEIRLETKKRADEKAINIFAENLRQLLLAPPLGRKRVLAVDPGFRTGCKVVCLDAQGKLLHSDTIYPHKNERADIEAAQHVKALCDKFHIEAIAVGNGTAGRETERFLRGIGLPASITLIMVDESGASVYSASEAAREEFPDRDLTVRGAVSIGRRLMDPLAELVKIDPKAIGVGQYQHDVDQRSLKKSLDDVVVSCVNAVGVEVNTASAQLLAYVSGLGPQLARQLVKYRDENGPFLSRQGLKAVPRLGPKAFEQAAGFLRINGAANPLDSSAVHPESYPLVEKIAADLGCSLMELAGNADFCKTIPFERYVTETVGLPTLTDIVQELAKPGRDPREHFEPPAFREDVENLNDLKPGMKLPGIVTNITAFGAFVDIGVHQDGLVHISRLADRYVKDPAEVVKVRQKVEVTVLDIDIDRKRISLSMREREDLRR
ncbi:MAG TPA: RNA-binding transcriptional accessory protein [Desulfobacteraceae bacterium]|nr:RNA-binding transcriptional accessory protein [Desulfobacteraceae bacterium]